MANRMIQLMIVTGAIVGTTKAGVSGALFGICFGGSIGFILFHRE